MINIEGILNTIKSIVDSDKRFLLTSWLFFSVIIVYLYNDTSAFKAEIAENEKNRAALRLKDQEDCQFQMNESRRRYQLQIDTFMEESNRRNDSTFRAIYKTVKLSNRRTEESIYDIKDLKK
jgi:hypothetical protein